MWDRTEEKRRFLLKIRTRPGAVALTLNSQLIVGSTGGRVVVFNLNLLTPPEGKLCQSLTTVFAQNMRIVCLTSMAFHNKQPDNCATSHYPVNCGHHIQHTACPDKKRPQYSIGITLTNLNTVS